MIASKSQPGPPPVAPGLAGLGLRLLPVLSHSGRRGLHVRPSPTGARRGGRGPAMSRGLGAGPPRRLTVRQ
jgi:hypothetical protein